MSKYLIKSYGIVEQDQLLALHQTLAAKLQNHDLTRLKNSLWKQQAVVAWLEQEVVGFCRYELVGDVPQIRGYLQTSIDTAKRLLTKEDITETALYFNNRAEQLGTDFSMVGLPGDNYLTKEDTTVSEFDVYISEIIVKEPHHNRGIGKALLEQIITRAKEKNSSAMYLDSWRNRPTYKPFSNCGFLPIVTWGPVYNNGDWSTVMGRKT